MWFFAKPLSLSFFKCHVKDCSNSNFPYSVSCRSQPLTLQDLENIMQSCNPENLTFNAVDVDTYWVDEPEVLAMAVKLLIERATNQDWMLRVKWLCHLAKNIPQGLGE